MRWGIALSCAVALAACQTTGPTGSGDGTDAVPADHRAQIVEWVRVNLKDPYSVRDPEISAPMQGLVADWVYGGNRPYVCARFNAKNSFGAYSGVEPIVFTFRDGRIVAGLDEMPGMCLSAVYGPFPELAALATE